MLENPIKKVNKLNYKIILTMLTIRKIKQLKRKILEK